MRFLVQPTIFSENVGMVQKITLCILHSVVITIDTGMYSASTYHLTNYGILLNIIGNHTGAIQLVGLAQYVLQYYSPNCVKVGIFLPQITQLMGGVVQMATCC